MAKPQRKQIEPLPIGNNLNVLGAWLFWAAWIGLQVSLAGLVGCGGWMWADRLAERREQLLRMSRLQKAHLLQAQRRLEALDPAEQQRLRQLNRQIDHHPQAAQLRKTAQRYYAWLKTLPMYRRAELQEMPIDQRLKAIEKALQEEAIYAIRRPKLQDAEGLWQWMQQYALQHQAAVLATLPPERQQECQSDPEHCRRLVMSLLWRPGGPGIPSPSPTDLQQLYHYLSPQTRQRLQAMTPESQWKLIASWARYLVHYQTDRTTGWLPPEVNEAELLYFFEYELSPEQIDALLALPAEQMLQELRRLYFRIRLPHGEDVLPESVPPELPFETQ
ncbi:MAG: hypothetical protein NZ602_06300 [Thermoguttaceae bacterium]|nr:hypothetical protein [Thermoguttaceae bacterium]MDW8036871.1 hypothetical protein [Thermoguttaceae bacterium]